MANVTFWVSAVVATCTACGAPFSAVPDTRHDLEGGVRDEMSPDAPDAPDALARDTGSGDAHHDSDTGPGEGGRHDSAAPPDSGHDSGCLLPDIPSPPSPASYDVSSPAQYGISLDGSGWSTGSPTPPECQCASTYTCICLETNAPSLSSLCSDSSFPTFNSCFMSGTIPVITCVP